MKKIVLALCFTLCVLHFTLLSFVFALDLNTVKVPFLKGEYKAAIVAGEKLMAEDKSAAHSDELYYFMGVSYLKDGNYLRASDIFEIVLNEFKKSRFKEQAALGLADTFLVRGSIPEAGMRYEEFLRVYPDSQLTPGVYHRLAVVNMKNRDEAKMKEYQQKLKAEFPQSPEAGIAANLVCAPIELGQEDLYTVQVGSFQNRDNAQKLMQELSLKNYPAYIEDAFADSPPAYRVRVGKLGSFPEVEELKDKLSRDGYPTKICP